MEPHLQPELILSGMCQIFGPVPGLPAHVDVHKSLRNHSQLSSADAALALHSQEEHMLLATAMHNESIEALEGLKDLGNCSWLLSAQRQASMRAKARLAPNPTSVADLLLSAAPGCRIWAVYSWIGLPPVSGGSCHRSCRKREQFNQLFCHQQSSCCNIVHYNGTEQGSYPTSEANHGKSMG
jgi:hypothetical protein